MKSGEIQGTQGDFTGKLDFNGNRMGVFMATSSENQTWAGWEMPELATGHKGLLLGSQLIQKYTSGKVMVKPQENSSRANPIVYSCLTTGQT